MSVLRDFRRDPIRFLRNLADSDDGHQFKIGRHLLVLLTEPSEIEEVLVSKQEFFKKGPGLLRLRPLLGDGLLTADGARHRESRRVIAPVFSRARLTSYGQTMHEIVEEICDSWIDGQVIDVQQEMVRLTLGVIRSTIFRTDRLSEANVVCSDVGRSMQSLYRPLSRCPRERSDTGTSSAALCCEVETLIAEHRADKGSGSIIAVLQAEGDSDSVRDDVMTFLLAGHESVATALTWTWYAIAQNQAVTDHLDGLVSDQERALELTDYIRMIISESLRLYPPAWLFSREALDEVTIGMTKLPAGTIVLTAPCVTHVDSRFWDEPLSFLPERWANSSLSSGRPRYAYFPFGGGSRRCIGEQFAVNELTIAVSMIASRYSLEHVDDCPAGFDPLVTLRPLNPIKMTLRKRLPA